MEYKIGDFVLLNNYDSGLIVDTFINGDIVNYDIYFSKTKSIKTYSANYIKTKIGLNNKIRKFINDEYKNSKMSNISIQSYIQNHNMNNIKYKVKLINTELVNNKRAFSCLDRFGIKTLFDLICLDPITLYRIRNVGRTTGKYIADFIIKYCKDNDIDLVFQKELYYKDDDEIYSECM